MEITSRKPTANIFEAALAFIVFLAIVFSIIEFVDFNSSESEVGNPFAVYNSNPGIRRITILKFLSYCSFFLLFVALSIEKFKNLKVLLGAYLFSAFAIAFLQWYELYYGSTFYYGEVRDKQGLGYPILSSLMVTLIIWKLDYSESKERNLTIKLILTGVINIGLYQLYNLVYEPWNLWQS